MVKVKNSEFIKSAQDIRDSIQDDMLEVVFMGRSNVGKSSLISSLLNKKGLAKSSSTPGKTRLINFFNTIFTLNSIDKFFRVVDLPGIGYAKVSKSEKIKWQKNLMHFIKVRKNIILFIYLVDSRHRFLQIDKDTILLLNNIKSEEQGILIVYTKVDKLKLKEKNVIMRENSGNTLVSITKNIGIDELREKVYSFLDE